MTVAAFIDCGGQFQIFQIVKVWNIFFLGEKYLHKLILNDQYQTDIAN